MLFIIKSGFLDKWAEEFPDPRRWSEVPVKVIIAAALAARFAGLYSLRKTGYYAIDIRTFTSSIANIAPRLSLQLRERASEGDHTELTRLIT